MTRSEWINIIGIAVAILTVCFLVIQQTASIRSELHRVEARLDSKIESEVQSLEAKIESLTARFGQIEQNQARLEGEVGVLKEVTLDSVPSPP